MAKSLFKYCNSKICSKTDFKARLGAANAKFKKFAAFQTFFLQNFQKTVKNCWIENLFMDSIIFLLALITFASTLIGGLVVIKFRKGLPYFFAFAAGSLIAVAFLDILPESIEIAGKVGLPLRYLMLAIVASFFVYSLLEKFFATHHIEDGKSHEMHGHIMGPIGAGSLVLHSFLDGVAIGASYQFNPATGLIVAFAVISHDFTDGMNTVTVMLKNGQKLKNAVLFLIFDAIAPVAGILATMVIAIPEKFIALILAFFVGEFIYIGAATLTPETAKHPSKKIILATLFGIIVIAILTSLI